MTIPTIGERLFLWDGKSLVWAAAWFAGTVRSCLKNADCTKLKPMNRLLKRPDTQVLEPKTRTLYSFWFFFD